MNKIYTKTFLILSAAIFIASCGASKQQAMLDTIDSPQTRPATFEALDEDLRRAERNQVNLISPEKYLQAKELVEAARATEAQGQTEEEYSEQLNKARMLLDSAMAFTKNNKDRMDPLIVAREAALTSGAAETVNQDLEALEKEYLFLVANLEDRDSREDAIKQIPNLTRDYENITIKTIQNKYLGEARNNLDLAKKENAKNLVPKTLKETEAAVKRANDYIAQDQKIESMIAQLGNEALLASRRLLVLTRQTQMLEDLSPEDISLKTEALLNSAGASLNGKDLRELSFESHAAALNGVIEQLNRDQRAMAEASSGLQSSLSQSKKKISELEDRSKSYARLEQRDEKNKEYESVRELFDEDEAKVYRQGDSLVISLKKINFPVNVSEIPSSSFGLLKKVQSAIGKFNEPSVVIEGHTDSTGTVALNRTLSAQRAEAVEAYLRSNSVVAPERLTAVGYGSEKPLASNQSREGRATNRRIDIVIKD